MEAWRDELTVTPDYIQANLLELAYRDQNLVGFYGLEFEQSRAYLQHLWVEPAHIGTGLGRILFDLACRSAKTRGCHFLDLTADPNAEPFYLHMGAVRTGEDHRSVLSTPRVLPKMSFDLSTSSSPA
jgi:GNAT superfamily N-acetyltransferase